MAKNISRTQFGRLSTKDLYASEGIRGTTAYAVGNEQFFGTTVTLPPTVVVRRRASEVISS
jgi:hypothetical protein